MLDVADAQKRIWSAFQPLGSEWLPLSQCRGRVLAEDVKALRDQPPAAMSAMDGYALRARDVEIGKPLQIIGESQAGHPYASAIKEGEAVRIFTGAVIPKGADAILIQENAERTETQLIPKENVSAGLFVRDRGLDFTKDWIGLTAGQVLDPRHIGLAASLGHAFLCIRRRPKIAVIATGDELRWPGSVPDEGQIISSNTPTLAAMVDAWGGEPMDLGIIADKPEPLRQAFDLAAHADLIVTTGGASVGDFDLVQETAGDAGMALDFWKIRMRPGKPLIFGHLRQTPLLGLPGNPVSSAVCALIFMRGALMTMLGLCPQLTIAKVELAEDLPANGERQDYARGSFIDSAKTRVQTASKQDSSMFATFAQADVLIARPPHDPKRQAGELVNVIKLNELLIQST